MRKPLNAIPRKPIVRKLCSIGLFIFLIAFVFMLRKPQPVSFDDSPEIFCQTSQGPFRIQLNPAEAPRGVTVLKQMVRSKWFEEGGGVAFFRKNKVATQFGVKEKIFKFNWAAINLTSHEEWRDASPESDRAKRPHWPRGTVYMIGGTQMVVVLQNGRHYQGKNDFEARVGWISEDDMSRVFDRIYAYNDIIDNPKGGPGPDQRDIYLRGWQYLSEQFPLVDRITSCHLGEQ